MLDAIHFDTTGFKLHQSAADARVWRDATPDHLSLRYFGIPPRLPGLGVDVLRPFFRDTVVDAGGGLVELDSITLAGLTGIRMISKFRQQPSGMRYLGSMTLPFASFSYVIEVEAMERGMTGMRDAVLFNRHLASNAANSTEGWFRDPYDTSRRDPLMRNGAEDEADDAAFPDHPLSRVRRVLGRVAATLRVDPRVSA